MCGVCAFEWATRWNYEILAFMHTNAEWKEECESKKSNERIIHGKKAATKLAKNRSSDEKKQQRKTRDTTDGKTNDTHTYPSDTG